jgi:hypothetical protein
MLFDSQSGVEAKAEEATSVAAPPASSSAAKKRHQHGRGRIPERVQREEVTHDLSEAEMAAMGGAENLVELPPERSEQLDWRPSTLLVIVHVRKKYTRKTPLAESGLTLSEQNVAVARKPAEAIPGALWPRPVHPRHRGGGRRPDRAANEQRVRSLAGIDDQRVARWWQSTLVR